LLREAAVSAVSDPEKKPDSRRRPKITAIVSQIVGSLKSVCIGKILFR